MRSTDIVFSKVQIQVKLVFTVFRSQAPHVAEIWMSSIASMITLGDLNSMTSCS